MNGFRRKKQSNSNNIEVLSMLTDRQLESICSNDPYKEIRDYQDVA